MLNCHDATRLMSEAEDRELSLGERVSLRLHVTMCSGCRHFQANIRSLRTIVRAYVRGDHERAQAPPPDEDSPAD